MSKPKTPPDLLQDNTGSGIFRSLQHDMSSFNVNSSFNGTLEENLTDLIRSESRAEVDSLIEKIKQLSIVQRILLYLKLPSSTEDPDQTDPLRRPLNPLGNRLEVSQAIAYIKTHFLPDPDISLPKKEIYNEYVSYCSERKVKPLSTADFGKAMKQVYPVVRPRRLGERGNSRYCYSGLCKRDQLNKPRIKEFHLNQIHDGDSRKICGWASKILNVPVDNLTHLSYIIPSVSSSAGRGDSHDTNTGLLPPDVAKRLVQKKLNVEVENLMRYKSDRHKPYVTEQSKVENAETSSFRASKPRKKSNREKSKAQKTNCTKSVKYSVDTLSTESYLSVNSTTGNIDDSVKSKVCDTANQKQIGLKVLNIKNTPVDNIDLKTEKSTNVKKRKIALPEKLATNKKSRRSKKISNTNSVLSYESKTSPVKGNDPLPTEDNFGIASIEEEPFLQVRLVTRDSLEEQIVNGSDHRSIKSEVIGDSSQQSADLIHKIDDVSIDSNEAQDCDQTDIYNDIGYLKTESLCNYLQEEGNSQEPEEELLKYFKDPANFEPKEFNAGNNISQLRLLLEQNFQKDTTIKLDDKPSEMGCVGGDVTKTTLQVDLKNRLVTPLRQSLHQPSQKSSFPSVLHCSSAKRRVSFENIPDSFPQSPSTHQKNFSFIPISPRPPTVSKSSVNMSPFVFPRETVFRGKLSVQGIGGVVPHTPAPSPITQGSTHSQTQVHVSPLKSFSQSTSFSSTPSPVTNGRCSSSNIVLRGRSTPQDTSQEQTDSVKSSPLISPSSSSGVFLSPASPMSSCNSPVFTFRKIMSPVKQSDELKQASKSSSSLLQSLLLTGKCPDTGPFNGSLRKSETTNQKLDEPPPTVCQLLKEVSFSAYRSQSVPTLMNTTALSPSSNTQPFPSLSSSKTKEIPPLLEMKQTELDVLDSWFNGCKSTDDNLIIADISDHDTADSDRDTVGNEVSVESVISNLCDFLHNKSLPESSEIVKTPQVSRSHPNTPLIYNECSSSSRDPVVSAFSLTGASKSYPSTPTCRPCQTFDNVTSTSRSSTKRNIIPLLDNMPIPVPSFSDEMDPYLDNFTVLSACDDAFNELAREVASDDAVIQ